MSRATIRIQTGVLLVVSTLALQCMHAEADDMPACHDLPAHQAVLNAGQETLDKMGSGFNAKPRWNPTADIGVYSRWDVQPVMGSSFPQVLEPPADTALGLKNLPIESLLDQTIAIKKAQRLEQFKRFDLAEILYDRLLEKDESKHIAEDQLAASLYEGVIRTKFKVPLKASTGRQYSLLWYERYGAGSETKEDDIYRFSSVDAMKNAKTDLDLNAAEKLCLKAMKIRALVLGNRELTIEDMMMLGGLAEKKGKMDLALCCYIPAIEFEHHLVPPEHKLNNISDAPNELQTIFNAINRETRDPEQRLIYLHDLNELIARIPPTLPGMAKIKRDADQQTSFLRKQISAIPCLEMAAELNSTAFALERNNQFDMASKLYNQALEIKRTNLGPKNKDTTKQAIDVARVAGEQKKYLESKQLFLKAIADLKANPQADWRDVTYALESYGQMLSNWGRKAEAAKAYEEARQLSVKTKHPVQ